MDYYTGPVFSSVWTKIDKTIIVITLLQLLLLLWNNNGTKIILSDLGKIISVLQGNMEWLWWPKLPLAYEKACNFLICFVLILLAISIKTVTHILGVPSVRETQLSGFWTQNTFELEAVVVEMGVCGFTVGYVCVSHTPTDMLGPSTKEWTAWRWAFFCARGRVIVGGDFNGEQCVLGLSETDARWRYLLGMAPEQGSLFWMPMVRSDLWSTKKLMFSFLQINNN